MRFSFTDEQEEFRGVVQRFLRDHSSPTAVRRLMASDTGYDPDVWARLCGDLGLAGIAVPESCGGQGFGFEELAIVLEEMGRSLLCAPFFSSAVLAVQAIVNGASGAQKQEWLPKLASGQAIGALAVSEAGDPWHPGGIALTARPDGDGYRLNGVKTFVLDGHIADLVIVAGRAPGSAGEDGIGLFVVQGNGDGLDRRPLDTIDKTRRQAELTFRDVRAERLGGAGTDAGRDALRKTLDQAAIALACEMVGGARALLDAAVDYAKMRVQFGRVIGSFQAIKHKCADMLLSVELARAAAFYAAAAMADGDPEASALASVAKACASDAYMQAALECVQIHGGIGFTWDHDTHLWFKRAKSSEVMFGDAAFHRERYLQLTEGQS
jgi:alkylation response protein AidB-like acyl-CoA dehydrogenase